MNATPSFSLVLFGSPRILDPRGAVLSGRAAQRHRLALLALLAASDHRGQARERLMAWLWPEKDTTGARQLLNQAVYVLRRELGEEVIQSGPDELRLNAGADLFVDVIAFGKACSRGDHEAAVALYAGPFLDGFFLGGSQEFEAWTQAQRDRLADMFAAAVEALADDAAIRGDHAATATWWKRRAAHDPLDSRVALRLMEALATVGNAAGALQAMRTHEQLLRSEHGTEPPPELRALAERLRSAPAAGAAPAPAADAIEIEQVPAGNALDDASPLPAPAVQADPPGVRPTGHNARWRRIRRAVVKFGLPAAAAVAAAVAIAQFRPAAPEVAAATAAPSIAVLPLENLGAATDAPLANGMTEELIAKLAQSGALRVSSSVSVRSYVARGVDLRTLADSLQVGHVLEGGWQRVGERIRVQIRLVDASDGATRWSETYDRDMSDIFAVQDEIAERVARELGTRLAGVATSRRRYGTGNVVAYEMYLRGADQSRMRSDSAAREGLALMLQALALDSTYAAAWAGAARLYFRTSTSASPAERSQLRASAEAAARRAVAIDDSLAEAHSTLGGVLMDSFRFEEAERHLKRAIALDPSQSTPHERLVTLSLWTDRAADALKHARRAVDLEPMSPTARAELANALAGADDCSGALVQLDELSGLQPPLLRLAALTAQCQARLGRWHEAVATARALVDRHPPGIGLFGFFLGMAGRRSEAVQIRDELINRWQRGAATSYDVALLHAGLGAVGEAIGWLEHAAADGSLSGAPGSTHIIILSPLFAHVHADPRFDRVRRRINPQNL